MFEYFFSSQQLSTEYLNWIFDGLIVTILLSFYTIVISTLLGFVVVTARDCNIIFLRWLATIYILFFRNTPLLIQLFFWYFAVGRKVPESIMKWLNTPHQFTIISFTIEWPSFEFLAGVIGLIFYSTTFIAEELRAGIYGVKQGQKFAGLALGLSNWQAMRYIILPQALQIAMPSLLGQYTNIIKNSSLTMAIGVAELSYVSRQIESQSLRTFTAFGVATILYIAIIAVIEVWGQWRHQRLFIKVH